MAEPRGLKTLLIDEMIAMLMAGASEPSLRELAKRVGVSAMASYRHFPSKAALVEAVADKGFAMLRAELAHADGTAQGRGALVAQGLAYVGFAMARPRLFRLMFSNAAIRANAGSARYEARAVLTRRIEQVVPKGGSGAALACWALVHGLAVLQIDSGTDLSADAIHQALTSAINGIAAP